MGQLGSTYKAAHTAPFSKWDRVCSQHSCYPMIFTLKNASGSDK
jgi:hypothetical protein